MPMLKAEHNWSVTKTPPELSLYGSWLSWIEDVDLRHATLAANINILRRRAPFVYLFANGFTAENRPEDIYFHSRSHQHTPDAAYLRTLTTVALDPGVWLPYPLYDEPTTTVVTALEDRDILPFIPTLDGDNHSLICLPNPLALDQIEQTVYEADSSLSTLEALLKNGGCHIHILDSQAFSVQTFDHGYAEYFPLSPE